MRGFKILSPYDTPQDSNNSDEIENVKNIAALNIEKII